MLTESDERMAKLKAAINRCRDGGLRPLFNLEISRAELITISALAKATGDAFTYNLTRKLIRSMDISRQQPM
jgi:hypothetical protein